jgi:hypothetical protein
MVSPPNPTASWWLGSVVLPCVFLVLGAIIGFAATWVRDHLDARNAKRAFLRAIRRELEAVDEQLQNSISTVETATQRLKESQHLPQFTLSFENTVYSTQLGKLKDLDDPLLLEIVRVYSGISRLDDVARLLNEQSSYVQSLKPPSVVPGVEGVRAANFYFSAVARVGSRCEVLLEQLRGLQPAVHKLAAKLSA